MSDFPAVFSPPTQPFEVRPSDGKGLGCIAARDIALGERVLAEMYVCVGGMRAEQCREMLGRCMG